MTNLENRCRNGFAECRTVATTVFEITVAQTPRTPIQIMSITIAVPSMLRQECAGLREFELNAKTVAGVLDRLAKNQPKLYHSVCDDSGAIRQHVNLFVNNDIVNKSTGLKTSLKSGDVVYIMPAVSGG